MDRTKAEKWLSDFYRYVQDPPPMGQLARLAVDRHHLMAQDERMFFDEKAVLKVFRAISILKHSSGEWYGKPFQLMDFQKFIVGSLYGWKWKDTGFRVFTRAYLSMARKSGKSELLAALALVHTWWDGEGTPESYVVANKYEQSTIVWHSARRMAQILAQESRSFRGSLKIFDSIHTRRLVNTSTDGIFAPLASQSKTLDGYRPSFCCLDEFHEAQDDSVLNVMSTGMVNRKQPLLVIITTAGYKINGVCHRMERVMKDLLLGHKEDPTTFSMIFTLDPGDSWDDPTVWYKSNPGLGVTVTLESLQAMCQRAKNTGLSAITAFKTKNCNIWVSSSKGWMDPDDWNKCPATPVELDGMEAWGAVDTASNFDLSVFSLLFDLGDQKVIKNWYFAPLEGARARARKDQVPYLDWADQGKLILTPGKETDFDFIEDFILKLGEKYQIQKIAYDPWNCHQMAQRLVKAGAGDLVKFHQRVTEFNEPVLTLERWISRGILNHQGDPVLAWMFKNVVLRKNHSGLVMFDRERSQEKIDGMVSLAMCVGLLLDSKFDQEDPAFTVLTV